MRTGARQRAPIWSSSAGEFHPHALREPDGNLSIHPAPIVQPGTQGPNEQTDLGSGFAPGVTKSKLVHGDLEA
jgi:hypothetical protein